jgi:hypothetical protein
LLERIARLCSQFTPDDLAAAAARFSAAEPLDRIVAGVRAGADPADLKSDLDELDNAFARNGIDNVTTGPRVYRELPGSGAHPVMRVWVCPAAQPCSRVEVTGGAGCGLLGKPLTCRDVQS